LQRSVARPKANAQGAGPAPYAGIDTGALANALRDSSVVSLNGSGASAVVAHGLGGNGSAGNGAITVAPVSVAMGGAGSGFAVTLGQVNHAACPALASIMQRGSDVITVAGRGGPVKAQDDTLPARLGYGATAPEAQCTQGDNTTFVCTVR